MRRSTFAGRWNLYFYVPKGTKTIGGYASGVGDLPDGVGKKVHTFDKKAAYFSVMVPAGQDGRLEEVSEQHRAASIDDGAGVWRN